jgi:hypothetical protein
VNLPCSLLELKSLHFPNAGNSGISGKMVVDPVFSLHVINFCADGKAGSLALLPLWALSSHILRFVTCGAS